MKINLVTDGKIQNPWVLLIHGFMGASLDWEDWVAGLSQHFYLVRLDLPGHGESEGPEESFFNSSSRLKKNIIEKLESLFPTPSFSFELGVGYSLGGRVIADLAVTKPSLFKKLILISSQLGIPDKTQREARYQSDLKLSEELINSEFESFLLKWYQQPLFKTLAGKKELLLNTIAKRKDQNKSLLAKALIYFSVGLQANLLFELKLLKSSITFIVGQEDEKYLKLALQYYQALESSRIYLVPGSSHALLVESQRVVQRVIFEIAQAR